MWWPLLWPCLALALEPFPVADVEAFSVVLEDEGKMSLRKGRAGDKRCIEALNRLFHRL